MNLSINTSYIPIHISELTFEQRYDLVMIQTALETSKIMTNLMILSILIGIALGVLATIIYYRVTKK